MRSTLCSCSRCWVMCCVHWGWGGCVHRERGHGRHTTRVSYRLFISLLHRDREASIDGRETELRRVEGGVVLRGARAMAWYDRSPVRAPNNLTHFVCPMSHTPIDLCLPYTLYLGHVSRRGRPHTPELVDSTGRQGDERCLRTCCRTVHELGGRDSSV